MPGRVLELAPSERRDGACFARMHMRAALAHDAVDLDERGLKCEVDIGRVVGRAAWEIREIRETH